MIFDLAADDVALFSRRSDGVIAPNDVAVTGPGGVGDASPTAVPAGASGAVVRRITIDSPTSDASEHVIIDCLSIPFSLGTSTSAGWNFHLGTNGTDKLSFRNRSPPTLRDPIEMGDAAINDTGSITADTVEDIDYSDVDCGRLRNSPPLCGLSGAGREDSSVLGADDPAAPRLSSGPRSP